MANNKQTKEQNTQVTEKVETKTNVKATQPKSFTLHEVFKMAQKGVKFRRIGWKADELKEAYVTVLRGHTKLSFCKGNNCVPYQPSQEDAVSNDWIEISKE